MERDLKGRIVSGPDFFKLDEAFIISKYKRGLSCVKIAKLLNVSQQTIHRRLTKNNIQMRLPRPPKGYSHPNSQKSWFKKGQRSAAWKGGVRYTKQGYKEIWIRKKQRYVKEHRFIMEQHINRKLEKEECVHHINHDILDNRIENLQIITNSKHATLHGKLNYKNGTSALCKINNSD